MTLNADQRTCINQQTTRLIRVSAHAELIQTWCAGRRQIRSGPMHIADAIGTPVVALFGRGVPSEFGPVGPEHIIIEGKVDCRPCYVECKYSEPKC
jgi:hypothetical protein